ncbi:MAG: hypothetical protein ABI703_07045 [Gemmatimonadales bacterium]
MSRSIGLLLLVHSLLPSLLLSAALTGCDGGRREVAVRVSIPDPASTETPAAGVGVVALPYNRDSILASLEARARSPRPGTAALDSLFAQFRGPFTTYTAISYAEGALRDSIRLLRNRLDSLSRQSPDYVSVSAGYARMSDSLRVIEGRARHARVALDRARTDFVSRSESLRSAVRHWEDSTYRGYESIVEQLARARRREPVTDTTDATGWAHFTLAPGTWWIHARAWDTGDPNSQWYWNIPAESDTILLSSRTGQQRPRY